MSPTTFDEEDDHEPEEREKQKPGFVTDKGVENAEDAPLFFTAGSSKSNSINYIKVIRVDGGPGIRGYKGHLRTGATVTDLARKYGNGTYNLEGCNGKHKIIATETELEVSMPEYAETKTDPTLVTQGGGMSQTAMLHMSKMIADMASGQSGTVRELSEKSSDQVREMATQMMGMITTFTAAQRESERGMQATQMSNQQDFFAALQASAQAGHTQMMSMISAGYERERNAQSNPMQMVEVLVQGMKIGQEGGGEADPPWVKALTEGGGMLQSMAQLANAPGAAAATRALSTGRPAVRNPAMVTPPPVAPTAPPEAPAEGRKRTRVPINRVELRGFVKLRAELRKRGVSIEHYLAQSLEDINDIVPESLDDHDGRDNDDSPEPSTESDASLDSQGGERPGNEEST